MSMLGKKIGSKQPRNWFTWSSTISMRRTHLMQSLTACQQTSMWCVYYSAIIHIMLNCLTRMMTLMTMLLVLLHLPRPLVNRMDTSVYPPLRLTTWWQKNHHTYFTLHWMALDFLSVPGTSFIVDLIHSILIILQQHQQL